MTTARSPVPLGSESSSLVNTKITTEANTMPQRGPTLSEVNVSDTKDTARYVDVPAIQHGPLYQTMFPRSSITDAQKEEIICWYINMLEDAFENGEEDFFKVCSSDGNPVGFCGWTVIGMNQAGADGQANGPSKPEKKKGTWLPEVMDVNRWIALSRALENGT